VLLLFLQIVAATVIHSNHISHHVVSNFVLRSALEKTANKVIDDFLEGKPVPEASEKRLIEIYNRTQHKRLPIATVYD